MKTDSYYTDPIVYKEGFFKNQQEEQAYMNKLTQRLEKEQARGTAQKANKAKRARQ